MRVLLPYRPKHYLTQPVFRYCGAYQVAAIKRAMGDDVFPKKLFTGFSGLSGFCAPTQVKNKLEQLGVPSSIIKSKGSIEQLIDFLRAGYSSIILVRHAYDQYGRGFNLLKSFFCQHYISLRGYDYERRGFYVYDSSIKQQNIDPTLPIGNLFLDEHLLLRCWAWGLGIFGNVLISIPCEGNSLP